MLHLKLLAKKQLTPSLFTPPPAGKYIEHYLDKITRKTHKLLDTFAPCHPDPTNVYFFQRVKLLKARNDIIIKPADKNLGPTVMDRTWYFTEALSIRHLGDVNTYQVILDKPSPRVIRDRLICILKKYQLLHVHGGTLETPDDLSPRS